MGAHNGHRIAVGIASLDLCPAERIRVIGRPDLWKIGQNSEIEPVAARRASLKENVRETRGKLSHAPVQSQHIAVCHLTLPLRWKRCGIVIRKRPVHIPFDIGDLRRGKYLCHRLDDIVLHFRSRKIQDALIASLRMRFPRDFNRPVRMRLVEMTVHIHHLRLHPDTEIQSERLDLSSESRETSRKLLLVDFPVSQGMCVIIALAEPAVVHHKKLHAGFLCLLRQSKQLSLIDVKIGCLPTV